MIETLMGMGILGIVVVVLWLLPVIFILRSDKTGGWEKLIWILLIFFFSWFTWILYALVAPVSEKLENIS